MRSINFIRKFISKRTGSYFGMSLKESFNNTFKFSFSLFVPLFTSAFALSRESTIGSGFALFDGQGTGLDGGGGQPCSQGFLLPAQMRLGGRRFRNESMHRMHNAKITFGIMRLRGNWGQFEGSKEHYIGSWI